MNSEEKFLNKFTITVSAGNNVMFFMLCRSLSSFASHHEEAELTVHSGQYFFWHTSILESHLCIAESLEVSEVFIILMIETLESLEVKPLTNSLREHNQRQNIYQKQYQY